MWGGAGGAGGSRAGAKRAHIDLNSPSSREISAADTGALRSTYTEEWLDTEELV